MIICYISQSTIPSRTANSIHVMKICNALALNGNKVYLLVPKTQSDHLISVPNLFDYYGVEKNSFTIMHIAKPLNIKGGSRIFSLFAAHYAIKLKPDIIYSRDVTTCFFATFKKNLNVIYESHQPIDEINWLSKFVFKKTINRDNLIKFVTISNSLKEYYCKKYNKLNKKTLVAPDAADKTSQNKFINKKKLKGNGRFNVGYIGHLYDGRGIGLIAKIAERNWEMTFHLVGGNEANINNWVKKTKHINNIFFYGFIPPSEISSMMLVFDILIAPYQKKVSVSGGGDTSKWMSPLKIFEYMAAGKPIISSDLPVLREVLTNDRNSILCSPDNVLDWEKALLRLKNDLNLRDRLGKQAYYDFKENYTWDARVRKILEGLNN